MVGRYAPLLIFIILAIFLGIGLTLNPREVPSPLIDKPVPQFSLPQLQEPDKTIASTGFLNKVSILNVWASWCVACRQEHQLLVNLAKSGRADIYGLNYKDKRSEAISWLTYHGDPYLISAHDLTGKVGIDFGVYGVPETFIIDKQAIIRYKHIGPLTHEVLTEEIIPLVEQLKAVIE